MNSKIEAAISSIEKKYGKGSVISFDGERDYTIQRVPSGSLSLDQCLGGGWAKGRIIEIYGPESSGKTTLALHGVVEVQKTGKAAAFIDMEHSFDPVYAENIGISLSKDLFIFAQPSSGEEALTIVEELLKTNEIGIIIVDSVAAMTPQAEIEGDFGESKMGLHARLMSQGMRKLTSLVSKTNTILIFINQLREKIGVMFGNPETTTGGNALKFYASVRCDIRKTETLKDKDGNPTSNRVKVKVIKNKTAPPFQECQFVITYGIGISKEDEILDLGVELGIIKKSGSWFSYKETKLGQGRELVLQLLMDNPELQKEITDEVKANFEI